MQRWCGAVVPVCVRWRDADVRAVGGAVVRWRATAHVAVLLSWHAYLWHAYPTLHTGRMRTERMDMYYSGSHLTDDFGAIVQRDFATHALFNTTYQ